MTVRQRSIADLDRLVSPQLHPLRDYAVVADGHRGAIIGPEGECLWMCSPGWADEPIFGHLVGGPGCYTVRPHGRFVWGGYYELGSLIWSSQWTTCSGALQCRDALVAPGDSRRAVLLRQLRCLGGSVDVGVALWPGAGLEATGEPNWRRDGDAWTARVGDRALRWTGLQEAVVTSCGDIDGVLAVAVSLDEGDQVDLVLEMYPASMGPGASTDPPGELWRRTEAWWAASVPAQPESYAPRDAQHACAVLRGLTNPQGATVAAATTSLPERARRGPAYDYRYAWTRDIAYVGHAASTVGWEEMTAQSVQWITERVLSDGAQLLPAYTVEGQPIPADRQLDLPGYPGSDLVVGNQVMGQFQLDTLGEALILFADADRLGVLGADGFDAAGVAAKAIAARWNEPEAGIWELEDRQWAHSRLCCASGLRQMAERAPGDTAWWLALADELVADTRRHCVHPSGRWQRAPDDPRLDASLLLAQVRHAVAVDDPISTATRRAVAHELSKEHLVFRYQHGEESELGEKEGAFLLCNFWMALACQQVGEDVEAARWFERGRSSCGTPALFCEEYDVVGRQLRGNLPQSFVHAIFLEAAGAMAG